MVVTVLVVVMQVRQLEMKESEQMTKARKMVKKKVSRRY